MTLDAASHITPSLISMHLDTHAGMQIGTYQPFFVFHIALVIPCIEVFFGVYLLANFATNVLVNVSFNFTH